MGLNYDIFCFTSSDKIRVKSILPGNMYMLNVVGVVCVRVRAEVLVYTKFSQTCTNIYYNMKMWVYVGVFLLLVK